MTEKREARTLREAAYAISPQPPICGGTFREGFEQAVSRLSSYTIIGDNLVIGPEGLEAGARRRWNLWADATDHVRWHRLTDEEKAGEIERTRKALEAAGVKVAKENNDG